MKAKSYNFSWKDNAKTLIKLDGYLKEISDYESKSFIPVQDRIAVFDVDGTLVSETDPHYIVALLWLHAVLEDESWSPSAINLQLAKDFELYG